jgi:hypothetical protein
MDTKISPSFWLDPAIEPLDAEAKLALLWLQTAHISMCGWVSVSQRRFVFETACPIEALQRATQALGRAIVVHPDGYWLRDFIRQQIGDGQKLADNNMAPPCVKAAIATPSEISEAIFSEYPSLLKVLGKGLPSPCQAQEKEKEKEKAQRKSRGSAEGEPNLSSTPSPSDRILSAEKKEEGGDPPDLISYLVAIEKYNKGNPDGLVIPPAFVRHWHNLRVSTAWYKTGSETPIPNDFSARLGDLKVLARSYQQRSELASFATPVATAAKKETAPLPPCPTPDWHHFARTTVGWALPPDSTLRWEDLSPGQRSEFQRNWDSEQRRKAQSTAA